MNPLLHSADIRRIPIFGTVIQRQLLRRISETRAAAKDEVDPDISVVIRSRNNVRQLESLLRDIKAQDFTGKIELIVVDTESHDESVSVAKKFGAKVVNITQAEFSYPKALNLGFEAATKPWVFSFVDHSTLSSRYVFKTATRWQAQDRVAAAWALSLPNDNATIWEQLGYLIWVWGVGELRPAHDARRRETEAGFLAANDLVIRREVWRELGGFDESFGAGGEDTVLGQALLAAGYRAVYDPALSVHHTHGLGFRASLQQVQYWRSLKRRLPFDQQALTRFRKDVN